MNAVYQRDAKDAVARENGARPGAYYLLPYPEWAAIRDRAKRCPVTGRVNPNWPNPAPWADAT